MRSGPTKRAPSKLEDLLSSLDLGAERTPAELEGIAAEISRAIDECEDLGKMARSPKKPRLMKKHVEEVLPLTHLARFLFPGRQDVRCQPNMRDTENYDAVITFSNGGREHKLFVEFTYAKCGHEDSLRIEVLNDKGRVNLLGNIKHSGTKHTGRRVEVADEVVPRERTLQKQRSLIIDRVKAKAGRKYGPQHILVVVFDDYLGFRSDQDMAALKTSLATDIDRSALDFGRLYLVGSSGNTLVELPLKE